MPSSTDETAMEMGGFLVGRNKYRIGRKEMTAEEVQGAEIDRKLRKAEENVEKRKESSTDS